MSLQAIGILVIVSLIGVFELFLIITKRATISQWVWRKMKEYPWIRWVGIFLCLYLTYHLFG